MLDALAYYSDFSGDSSNKEKTVKEIIQKIKDSNATTFQICSKTNNLSKNDCKHKKNIKEES